MGECVQGEGGGGGEYVSVWRGRRGGEEGKERKRENRCKHVVCTQICFTVKLLNYTA